MSVQRGTRNMNMHVVGRALVDERRVGVSSFVLWLHCLLFIFTHFVLFFFSFHFLFVPYIFFFCSFWGCGCPNGTASLRGRFFRFLPSDDSFVFVFFLPLCPSYVHVVVAQMRALNAGSLLSSPSSLLRFLPWEAFLSRKEFSPLFFFHRRLFK